jgi:hypothetical protein
MLAENKFSKYMLYAIGEIMLVVIGILIALQINNWNSNRKNSEFEQSILADIELELSTNIERLMKVIDRHEQSHSATEEFIRIFEDSRKLAEVTDGTVTDLLMSMDYNETYNPTSGILESIISSGQINYLKNKELKYLLASVDDLTEDANESTKAIEAQRPFLLYPSFMKSWIVEDEKIVGYSRKRILHDPQFRMATYALYYNFRLQGLKEEKELLETLNTIKSIIEQEKIQ